MTKRTKQIIGYPLITIAGLAGIIVVVFPLYYMSGKHLEFAIATFAIIGYYYSLIWLWNKCKKTIGDKIDKNSFFDFL